MYSVSDHEMLQPLILDQKKKKVVPLDITVSLQPAAINTGLRSEMGLAVIILPPTAWKHKHDSHGKEVKMWLLIIKNHFYVLLFKLGTSLNQTAIKLTFDSNFQVH